MRIAYPGFWWSFPRICRTGELDFDDDFARLRQGKVVEKWKVGKRGKLLTNLDSPLIHVLLSKRGEERGRAEKHRMGGGGHLPFIQSTLTKKFFPLGRE